jgi:aminoglycoside phosphotransferase (APT) family kinase protein
VTALTPEGATQLRAALHGVCDAAGVDPTGAELIKYTNNAVYRLPAAAIVVRLGVSQLAAERAHRVTAIARWLAAHDAPVVRLVDHIDQPVRTDGYVATFWVELRALADESWTGADLAEPLHSLHHLTPPTELADWDPFTAARLRLKTADGLADEDLAWLHDQWERVEDEYHRLRGDLRIGLIHGDAHTGNLLRGHDGRVVLCDLDSTSRGPLAWDLVPTAVGALRFGRSDRHAELAKAYGCDVTGTQGWPVLRRIRELTLVTSVVPDLSRRPDVAVEHAHRMRALLQEDAATRWHRYR